MSIFYGDKGPVNWKAGYTTGSGPLPTDKLTVSTKDALFLYQWERPDRTALNEEVLMVTKITETNAYAHSVFKSLVKMGIIDQHGHPDTTKISSKMVSKIGIISVPKNRELVDFLFWWEEELTRWNLLDKEIADVKASIKDGHVKEDNEQVQVQLNVLEAKKKILPSMRRQDGTVKEVEGQQPPEYRGN